MPEDTRSRLLRYLNDAHAMEVGGLVTLEDCADRSAHPETQRLFHELAGVARSQIDRLTARIESLGGKVEAQKGMFNSVLAKGHRLTNAFHDQADKETQDVAKAVALSSLEVASYTALSAYSRAIGDEQTAMLGDTLAAEERLAADRLNALVPTLAVLPATQPTYYAGREMSSGSSSGSNSGGGGAMAKSALPALALGGAAIVTWAIVRSRSSSSSGNGGGYSGYREGNGGWERSSATKYGTTRSGSDWRTYPSEAGTGSAGTATMTATPEITTTPSDMTTRSGMTTTGYDMTTDSDATTKQPDITAGAGTDEQTGQMG